MSKHYTVGYKRPIWKQYTHDFDVTVYTTKKEAQQRKRHLQNLGYIQVIIKLKHSETSLKEVS